MLGQITPVFETVASRKPMISGLGATRTLNENESGSTILFDKVDGIVVTLPLAPRAGTSFEFLVSVTLTSNAYKVITGVGTELLVGQILGCDTDTANATIVWPGLVASSYIAVSMNKTTTGGIKGDRLVFTCVNGTTWVVTGAVNNNGTVATPFSAS
jgi:hypothetical protein